MAACLHSLISNSGSSALFSAEKHRPISVCVVIGSSSSSSSRKFGNRTLLRSSSSCAYYSSSVRSRRIIKHVFGSSKYRAFCERWAMFATPVQCYGGFSGKSVIDKCRKRSDNNACASELEQMRRMPPLLRKVAWAAVAALLSWRCRAARAAEVLAVLATRSRSVWSLFWPKVLQVLSVFRDQGLIIAILLSLSAFFSMAETSITTLWPWKVQELAEKEPENGVFRLLRQDVTRFLTTILIGTTVVNIGATALVTEAATTLFGEAGISAATGVMTVVVLILTELTPKSIAVHNATEVARLVVRPVAWLSVVLYPVGRIVTALSMGMLKLLGLKNRSEHLVTEDELKLMLRGAELSGTIEEEEQDMIENVLDFKETHVREVMTPLVDVVAIDCKATLIEFRNLWETHQYSRVPVYESRIDNIVGIAYAMDMLDYVDQAEFLEKMTVGGIAHKPAYFVPDSMSVWNLLREFRIRKVHMAIVLNEYGGTVGIVTLEDVVEEIVGEIFDESDSKEEIRKKTGYVIERFAGVYDVDANTSIEDLAEALNVKLEEGSYETVSGYVCEAFGYIPRTGESISIVLPKELDEGSNEFGEEESVRQEEKRAKFQKYKLEIISGNARKVGSVRFEEISGDTAKKDTLTHVSPQIIRQSWDHGMETGVARENSTSIAPILLSKEKETKDAPTSFRDPYVANDSTEGNIVEVSESDLTVIATENHSIHVKEEEIHSSQQCDIDVTSTASVRSLNEKELEKGGNKKRKKRRKQTAGVHLAEGQESVNIRHTESK